MYTFNLNTFNLCTLIILGVIASFLEEKLKRIYWIGCCVINSIIICLILPIVIGGIIGAYGTHNLLAKFDVDSNNNILGNFGIISGTILSASFIARLIYEQFQYHVIILFAVGGGIVGAIS